VPRFTSSKRVPGATQDSPDVLVAHQAALITRALRGEITQLPGGEPGLGRNGYYSVVSRRLITYLTRPAAVYTDNAAGTPSMHSFSINVGPSVYI
jgi:hypothetical protein